MLCSPTGGFRAQLAWRVLGFAMCQVVHGDKIWPQVAGLLLIVFGPRPLTLLGASTAGFLLLHSLLVYPVSARTSLAEEHLVFFGLPLVAFLLALVVGRDRLESNAAQVALLRLSAALLMGFAGFHKLNYDFFDASVSCAHALGARLDAAWSLPLAELGVLPAPAAVVAMELGAAVLLVARPRVGILVTGAVLVPIALFGPTSLVSTVMALAMAGLAPGDGRVISAGLRRPSVWVGITCLWVALTAVVYGLYEDPTYIRILIFCWVISGLLVCVGLSLAHDGRRVAWSLPRMSVARGVLAAFVVVAIVNGVSPYLGLKSRMSFAMFSNLRADDDRWNHSLVPAWVSLREHDPFVRVDRIQWIASPEGAAAALPSRLRLERALISGQSLRARLEALGRSGRDAHLQVRFEGRSYTFRHAASNRQLAAWLRTLPEGKLFQRRLEPAAPQPCVH